MQTVSVKGERKVGPNLAGLNFSVFTIQIIVCCIASLCVFVGTAYLTAMQVSLFPIDDSGNKVS